MNWEKYFPPGYAYEMERNGAGLLLGLGAVLSLSFFGRLHSAVDNLYEYRNILVSHKRTQKEVQGQMCFFFFFFFFFFFSTC